LKAHGFSKFETPLYTLKTVGCVSRFSPAFESVEIVALNGFV